MPTYVVKIKDDAYEVDASDESQAKKTVRDDLGLKRLPNGTVVESLDTVLEEVLNPSQAPKSEKHSFMDLPNGEKATYLLAHPTLPDRSWTDEQRNKGEKRSDFIERILGSAE